MKAQRIDLMDLVGADIRNKIKELGRLWKLSENRLSVSMDVLDSWDNLMLTHRDGYNVLFTPQKITFPIHLTLLSKIILDSCFN